MLRIVLLVVYKAWTVLNEKLCSGYSTVLCSKPACCTGNIKSLFMASTTFKLDVQGAKEWINTWCCFRYALYTKHTYDNVSNDVNIGVNSNHVFVLFESNATWNLKANPPSHLGFCNRAGIIISGRLFRIALESSPLTCPCPPELLPPTSYLI